VELAMSDPQDRLELLEELEQQVLQEILDRQVQTAP
jgi:hypothetical protein